jgi:hypothetical protein
MSAYRMFPNSYEESGNNLISQNFFDAPLSCGQGSPQQPHPLLPGMNSVMSFLLRGDSLGGMTATTGAASNYSIQSSPSLISPYLKFNLENGLEVAK